MSKFNTFIQNLSLTLLKMNPDVLNKSNIYQNIKTAQLFSTYPINTKLNSNLLIEYLQNERKIETHINECLIYIRIHSFQENKFYQTMYITYRQYKTPIPINTTLLIDIPTYFLVSILKS